VLVVTTSLTVGAATVVEGAAVVGATVIVVAADGTAVVGAAVVGTEVTKAAVDGEAKPIFPQFWSRSPIFASTIQNELLKACVMFPMASSCDWKPLNKYDVEFMYVSLQSFDGWQQGYMAAYACSIATMHSDSNAVMLSWSAGSCVVMTLIGSQLPRLSSLCLT